MRMKGVPYKAGLAALCLSLCFLQSTADSIAQTAGLDPESAACVDCHETAVTGGETLVVCHDNDCGHPIAVNYTLLSSEGRGLRPPGQLDPAIKLTNGNIGCSSCHVPYSSDHEALAARRPTDPGSPDPMLVIDNSGSRLCLACHAK